MANILNASVVGRGEAVLVLANGLGTNQQTWRHIVAAFAEEYRILRFDYVGTPDATLATFDTRRYRTLHGHADDVIALLDELGIADATWVGHSVSGTIGLLAAVAAPELISRLVLISASPRYLDDVGYVGGFSRDQIDELIAAAIGDFHTWVGGFSPAVLGSAGSPEHVKEFSSYLLRMRPDIAYQTLETIFSSDHRDILPRVTQPVSIVQSQNDVAVPMAVGRYLADQLPHAILHEMRAEGHLPHLTAPEEVIAIVRAALAIPRPANLALA